ncbi:MAG: glycine cleavage system protein H [Planctomycetota bacterium]|jgi:glycine cleavage system H protein
MARRRNQTRDDFPSELLYTQGRLWVKRGKKGTARIGLNVPAIAERMPHLYFLDVQRRGYLLPGQVFGSADLDQSRLQLKSPFSCRISRVNWAAVQDPLLVMTEPFERGWLYEVGRVKDEAYDNMLDRDAYWAYLEFERLARRLGLKPTIGARTRWVRGLPWPDEMRVTFGGLTVLTGRILRMGRNQTFTPQWSRGDNWIVEVRFQQPSLAMVPAQFTGPQDVAIRWRYEVIDSDGSAQGASCYVVKAIEVEGPPPQSYYLLSIAKEDFGLRQIEEVSSHDPSRRSVTFNDWGRESYLELRQRRELLVDLPFFPIDNKAEEREIEVEGEPTIKLRADFPDEKSMTLECEAPMDGKTLISKQRWERGAPWWVEAERRVGDNLLMHGKLVAMETV